MNDEKPMELRDQLALSILNGLIASNNSAISEKLKWSAHFNNPKPNFDSKGNSYKTIANNYSKELMEFAYYLADQMRKVRLTSFE
jgi:hypothetical protein